jgi:ATP-dependent HslUV protease subunit HslV
MTTVVVVRKAGQVAIAADTMVTFGDTRLGHRFEGNSKIFKLDAAAGPTYIGMSGTVAHFPVLRKACSPCQKTCCCWAARTRFLTPSPSCMAF